MSPRVLFFFWHSRFFEWRHSFAALPRPLRIIPIYLHKNFQPRYNHTSDLLVIRDKRATSSRRTCPPGSRRNRATNIPLRCCCFFLSIFFCFCYRRVLRRHKRSFQRSPREARFPKSPPPASSRLLFSTARALLSQNLLTPSTLPNAPLYFQPFGHARTQQTFRYR